MKLINILFLVIINISSCQSQITTTHPPIIEAVITGNLAEIKQLLKDHNDINALYTGYTLLCGAVKSNQKDIVDYLLENGADLNKMSNQKTPLMYAAKYGRLRIAKMLIENGADKNVRNPRNKTALDYAKKYKQSKLITFLSEE